MSEALIFVSTNPQYDDRLFIAHENCKLRIPAEHVVYTNCCFCFDIQNNFVTQHVLQMLRASEKDLPVSQIGNFMICSSNTINFMAQFVELRKKWSMTKNIEIEMHKRNTCTYYFCI